MTFLVRRFLIVDLVIYIGSAKLKIVDGILAANFSY